ncbi:MAG: serine hydrolase domain-containing protein [Myxococcota bacterium]
MKRLLASALCVLAACGDDASPGVDAAVSPDGASPDASSSGSVSELLARRLTGDRTGACVEAALIRGDSVETGFACAGEPRAIEGSAFEIGSISKTMTGFLLTDLVRRGAISLDDPIADHLGVDVVRWEEQPLLVRHLLTHTSGLPALPPGFAPTNPANPYAHLTADGLLATLSDAPLASAPGETWSYSNYAFMVLSHVVAQKHEGAFVDALSGRMLNPNGFAETFVETPPAGVSLVQGHRSNGLDASPWTIAPTLSGLGMVRSTLNDMIRYARLAMGEGDPESVAVMAQAMEPLGLPARGPQVMASAWIVVPLPDRTLYAHGGGTGGFSSFVAVDRESREAVVLLSDTALSDVGGFEEVALHLLAPERIPLPAPRLPETAPETIVASLAGDYDLRGTSLTLFAQDGELRASVGGETLRFGYDSYGDFYGLEIDALLRPVELPDGRTTFEWRQGGGVLLAERAR